MTNERGTGAFDVPEQSTARHGRLPSPTVSRGVLGVLGRLAAVVLTACLVLAGIAVFRLWAQLQTVDLGDDARTDAIGAFTVLLVGTDDRTGQGAEFGEGQDDALGRRNDVNMLLHVSEDHTSATVVSIPRDMLFDAPACVSDEGAQVEAREGVPFNSVQEEGGMSCIIAAAEQLSGMRVDYAAMVQFRGVIEMSNALGGVSVCIANPIDDPNVGLSLPAGEHSLQGEEALKFLRTRYGVGNGSDLSRISNQQVFLASLVRKVRAEGMLSNPGALYGLATAAVRNMTLTSNLANPDVFVRLAQATADIPLESFVFVQMPVEEAGDGVHVLFDDAANEQLFGLLRAGQPVQVGGVPDAGATGDAGANGEAGATGGAGGVPDDGAAGADDGTVPDGGSGAGSTPGASGPPPAFTGQDSSQHSCSNV